MAHSAIFFIGAIGKEENTWSDSVVGYEGKPEDQNEGFVSFLSFNLPLIRTQQMYSNKDQIVNFLGFSALNISVITTQLCFHSKKAAIDSK